MGPVEIGLLIVTGIVVPAFSWYANHLRQRQKDQDDEVAEMEGRITGVEKQFQEYRVMVAANYTSKEDIREMTRGIWAGLERIEAKLDRKADRVGGAT